VADLLKLSEATALGLHAMVLAARAGEPVSVSAIAGELRASEAHLAKVLHTLARAGLLASKRGPGGGYVLTKPASQITLLDVYEALEGPVRRDGCLFARPVCDRVRCILGGLVERVRDEVIGHLAATTLQAAANERR
jgi:Rrf2 family protein